jgi:transcriptional regulator with XRE-family HTH domain
MPSPRPTLRERARKAQKPAKVKPKGKGGRAPVTPTGPLGTVLANLMARKGVDAAAVAQALEITPSHVSRALSGERPLKPAYVAAIAKWLDLGADERLELFVAAIDRVGSQPHVPRIRDFASEMSSKEFVEAMARVVARWSIPAKP